MILVGPELHIVHIWLFTIIMFCNDVAHYLESEDLSAHLVNSRPISRSVAGDTVPKIVLLYVSHALLKQY
jgi:hypothetical protein